MREAFVIIFLLLCPILYSNDKTVDVKFKDDSVVQIGLSPDLIMKFVDSDLVFESKDFNNRFSLIDVSGFYYSGVISSVDEDMLSGTFLLTANELQISGLPEKTIVRIYDIDGTLVSEKQTDSVFRLELNQLLNGIYVVKYNNVSRKFAVTRKS